MNDELYRRRIFRMPEEYFLEIRDTTEVPFVADDFPRGVLLFEAVDTSPPLVIERLVVWIKITSFKPALGKLEVLQAPPYVCRCRLFGSVGVTKECPKGHFAEVRDTVEEPYEYRGDLPSGELLVLEQHYSRFLVRARMNAHRKKLGVITAPSWNTRTGI